MSAFLPSPKGFCPEAGQNFSFGKEGASCGQACEDYDPLCACCRAWVEWNTNEKKVTIGLERDKIIDLLSNRC